MSADQYRCLTRHFARGFLENDLIAPGAGLEGMLGPLLAAIAVPGLLLPVSWLFAYGWPYRSADEFQALVIRHELFLLVVPMFVVAVAVALQWDTLYPDERDAAVLGPLPVPARTVFLAKASALMLFLGVVALACNGLASICYPLVANIRPQPGSPGLATTFLAHAAATFGAAAFAAFGVMAIPGALRSLLPARAFRSVAPVAQVTMVLGLVLSFLLMPMLLNAIGPGAHGRLAGVAPLPSDRALGRAGAGWLSWCPPLWFLGWYEVLARRGSGAARLLAARAQASLVLSAGVALVFYMASYARHVRRPLAAGSASGPRPTGRLLRAAGSAVLRIAAPNPMSRACLAFSVKTVARSARHRLIVAGALGVALAVSLTDLTTKLIRGSAIGAAGSAPAGILAIQALLMGLLLVGVRLAFSVPAPLQANWVFRLEGPEQVAEPRAGARMAAFVLGVVPPVALLAPLHVWQLGWRAAAGHATIGALAGLLFAEVLLTGYAGIPFTAAYVPGRARLKTRLVPYLAGFQLGIAALVAVEGWALQQRGRAVAMALALAGAYAALLLARRHDRSSVVYDEPPPDAIQTLGLEGPPDRTERLTV